MMEKFLIIRVNYRIAVILITIQAGFFCDKIVLIFGLNWTAFFTFFCFSFCKMVDSEYSSDNCKSSKISIGAIMKNPKMLRFVSDHLKTKKMCKHAVKKLPFKIRYVPD